MLRPSHGTIAFDGRDVTAATPQARNIAQVFQFPVIYDTMTVGENLAFPLRNRGVPQVQVRERVGRVAEMLDLSGTLDRRASGLAADAKQKISLGRGLVRQDVSAILFDEPLTVIDPQLKWQLRRKLKEIHHEFRLTLIYVTHDQTEALTFADQVVVMSRGKAVQVGPADALFERPAHTFVGHFIGSPGMNFLPGQWRDGAIELAGRATCRSWRRQSKRRCAGPAASASACGPSTCAGAGERRAGGAGAGERAAGHRHLLVADRRRAGGGRTGRHAARAAGYRGSRSAPGRHGLAVGVQPPYLLLRQRGTGAMKPVNQKAWLLVLPVVACVAFSAILPLMTIVNYSVQDIISPERRVFVGTEWFRTVLRDGELHDALLRQLGFSLAVLLVEIPLGILLALSMPARGWKASAVLVIIALSLLIPWNVVGTIWQIFGRTDIGLLGAALAAMGFDYNYTGSAFDAWVTVLVMDVWHWTPLVALLCYAGLRAIPDAYYQAAQIDGASRLAVFRYIQLPKLRGVLMIAVLLRFMDSFMIYTEPFVLTGGGPGNATTFLSQYLTQKAVGQFDLGPAAAFSIVYFLIILLMCFILYNWMQRAGTAGSEDMPHG